MLDPTNALVSLKLLASDGMSLKSFSDGSSRSSGEASRSLMGMLLVPPQALEVADYRPRPQVEKGLLRRVTPQVVRVKRLCQLFEQFIAGICDKEVPEPSDQCRPAHLRLLYRRQLLLLR